MDTKEETKLTPKEKQRIYNREYQNKTRKQKGLEHFGCLMTKDEKNIIMKEIRDSGMTIKAYIFNKIAKD